MMLRIEGSVCITQTWDEENRLIKVVSGTVSPAATTFAYDADGKLVKRTASQTAVFVGPHYELNTTTGVATS
jgi:YD repeat-containing protein